MAKLHIISNRLPFKVSEDESEFSLIESVGGLATGLSSVYKQLGGNWIGWAGISSENYNESQLEKIDYLLKKENCLSVHLTSHEIDYYYEGFSNNTIWPLFHYFAQYAEFNYEKWQVFKDVNQKFADAALEILEDGDTIWVNDYHLLLVPEMIKSKMPNVAIGFFLHIPFPSYEVFRLLPWRNELINGILGADLIGFHTFDYERHFISCVRRLIGYEINLNQIITDQRIILVDAFPMGIDYQKFADLSNNLNNQQGSEKSDFLLELERFSEIDPERKLVLSIDRLDYTKGIPNRLRAFSRFLEKYPEMIGKISLLFLAVPSRDQVSHYQLLKREVDELVGAINGLYGGINYTPIWYFYRSMPFNNLVELYFKSDIALVTPVRDGMNLVAKEYIASRANQDGVIILSEMAGVAKEMGEAIIINPNNEEEIADAIFTAANMPIEEQKTRISQLQKRLKRYDLFKWTSEFLKSIEKVKLLQQDFYAKKITAQLEDEIKKQFTNAAHSVLFLDYDGTLSSFKNNPSMAYPDEELKELVFGLTQTPNTTIVIISGRDKETLGDWFSNFKVNIIAEHGVWIREIGGDWEMPVFASKTWMDSIRPLLESFVDNTPGTFIEEKNFSLVWHFRKAEPEQGEGRALALKEELLNLIGNQNIEIMEGNKVIEVKNGGINKGFAANRFLLAHPADFIMAIGDDWTDEFMFKELPQTAITIKVGVKRTNANFKLESVASVRAFLRNLIS
ncbi:MAG: bifunctional alpha,alpha-trehalose-phosphate synthase (UDP-forming)/trehalose-phosphatase [Bacteroidia bacterium]|nr:bifunctional alpha,alpha-trehalose-phosphate synthase (UDP-forming)/trehalose-phosphatase [Bacteroidia bacterium]MCF8427622.1 bifunctional alpha,alpha-trehalose-phosphate synthase (UDP-forming)/trehalose-phosphatase [Bacteroidia bacterium]